MEIQNKKPLTDKKIKQLENARLSRTLKKQNTINISIEEYERLKELEDSTLDLVEMIDTLQEEIVELKKEINEHKNNNSQNPMVSNPRNQIMSNPRNQMMSNNPQNSPNNDERQEFIQNRLWGNMKFNNRPVY